MPWMDRGAAARAGCWDPLELCGVVARAYPAEPGQAYSTSGDNPGSFRWLPIIISLNGRIIPLQLTTGRNLGRTGG